MSPTADPKVTALFDEATDTVSFVVRDPGGTGFAAIDSVLDFDQPSGRTSFASADHIIAHGRAEGLEPVWILETHVHADHLSAAPYLRREPGGKTKQDFVATRTARDATLGMPKLIIPSIHVNMRAGLMPPPEDNGSTDLEVL